MSLLMKDFNILKKLFIFHYSCKKHLIKQQTIYKLSFGRSETLEIEAVVATMFMIIRLLRTIFPENWLLSL